MRFHAIPFTADRHKESARAKKGIQWDLGFDSGERLAPPLTTHRYPCPGSNYRKTDRQPWGEACYGKSEERKRRNDSFSLLKKTTENFCGEDVSAQLSGVEKGRGDSAPSSSKAFSGRTHSLSHVLPVSSAQSLACSSRTAVQKETPGAGSALSLGVVVSQQKFTGGNKGSCSMLFATEAVCLDSGRSMKCLMQAQYFSRRFPRKAPT
jgi:hypothetical protein